jgi:hypothetical protein
MIAEPFRRRHIESGSFLRWSSRVMSRSAAQAIKTSKPDKRKDAASSLPDRSLRFAEDRGT